MKIYILYGSQTGTSQFEALQLSMKFRREDFEVVYESLDEFNFQKLIEVQFLIIFISTTGVGDFPQNSKKFWDKLSIQYPNNLLENLEFSVFGFGDRAYANFNTAAKLIDIRLSQLGGEQFVQTRYGDAQHENGYLEQFTKWKKELYDYFEFQYEDNYQFLFNLKECQQQETDKQKIFQMLNLDSFQVINQEQISSKDHFQKINKLCLKSQIKYQINSGDCVSIKYKNNKELVNKLLTFIKPIKNVQFIKNKIYDNINFILQNQILNINFLLEEIFDVFKPPCFQILQFLSQYTDDQMYKEKLLEMTFEDYNDYILVHKRNLIEIFEDFKIKNVPLELILNFTPLITNRLYSITNYNNGCIEIIYNKVVYNTSKLRKVKGLCTSYLDDLKSNDIVQLEIQKGPFNYINKEGKFLIISTGTGIAPFLLFLRQKYNQINKDNVIFLFGCRNKKKDYIEDKYLQKLQQENKINLKVAFSRDQEEKFYVQHIIQKEKQFFIQFLKDNINEINILVCGNSKFLIQSIEKQFKKRTNSYIQNNISKQIKYFIRIEKLKKSLL